MLQVHHLSYEYDPFFGPVFQGVDISVSPGDKVALLGANGCGKSTLLRLLAGEIEPQTGTLIRSAGETVSILHQDFDFAFDGTVSEFFELSGIAEGHGWRRLSARLGLGSEMLGRTYPTLSPGEKMRVALAVVLAEDPDYLLLDEPTNHLDIEGRQWLENFLQDCRQGVLMVCHDRAMLDAVVDRTVVLEPEGAKEYAGGYQEMRRARDQELENALDAHVRAKKEVRRLKIAAERTLQRAAAITKRPTGRTYDPKQTAFYKGREARMDRRAKGVRSRLSHLQTAAPKKPFIADHPALEFPAQPLGTGSAFSVALLSKSFGSRSLFENISFSLGAGDRLAVVGPNGCGKTTLFRVLLGELEPDTGRVDWSGRACVACLTQERMLLDLRKTVLESLELAGPSCEEFARTLFGRLGLRGDAIKKKVGDLSVGERTKAELVKVLLTRANVLFLDEPTNHLDVESLEALEDALTDFPGVVVFTSHDRAFVANMATSVLQLGGTVA